MPSAPLFYQPLVQARVLATPIKDTTVFEAHAVSAKMTDEAAKNPKYGPAMNQILRGFEGLQAGLPGSKTLDLIQFAHDDNGWIANRVNTTLRLHPELLDSASPDEAAQIGANLVQEAEKELATNPGMKAVGDTLEVAPDVTGLLRQHWEGETPLAPQDAAYLGVTAARELQRAVTPLEADATAAHPWLEDATAWMFGMWPGAASKTAAALGLKADAAQVEEIVNNWRAHMEDVEPKVVEPLQSVSALLGAAGITGSDDAARDAAFQILQAKPLEEVPAGIAQAIVAYEKFPEDRAQYLTQRIVETSGTPGNVMGLIAEIAKMKEPVPVDPPPLDPPAPGGEEPPPPAPAEPQPAPDEPAKPPVDPPAGEPPPAEEPPPAAEPPATEPPAGDPPPATDTPPADDSTQAS